MEIRKGDKVIFIGNYDDHIKAKGKSGLTLEELCANYYNTFTIKTILESSKEYIVEEDTDFIFNEWELKRYNNDDAISSMIYALTKQMSEQVTKTVSKTEMVDYINNCIEEHNVYEENLKKYEENFKKLEERNMGKLIDLLKLYDARKRDLIDKKYDILKDELYDKDEVRHLLNEVEDQINVLMDRSPENPIHVFCTGIEPSQLIYSKDTVKESKRLDAERSQELEQLVSEVSEIDCLLKSVDTFEQGLDILKKRNIIDKNFKLKIDKEDK